MPDPAPEPPEVEAAELAAAEAVSAPAWEQHVRGIAEDRVRWVDRVSVQLFVEEYDRLKRERDEVRKEVEDLPDATHEQTMATLRWLWKQVDELGEMRPQWEHRGQVIKAVADAAGHEAEFPGQGLVEHVARMRAELTRTVADCGICRLGGRMLHIDDDCPTHGEGDW